MIYAYLIIYGNEQKYAKSLSVMQIFCYTLATEHLYGSYLRVHPRWRRIADACANVSLCPFTAYQALSLGSTRSFLRLTNVSLKHRYVCFHCFQVERV